MTKSNAVFSHTEHPNVISQMSFAWHSRSSKPWLELFPILSWNTLQPLFPRQVHVKIAPHSTLYLRSPCNRLFWQGCSSFPSSHLQMLSVVRLRTSIKTIHFLRYPVSIYRTQFLSSCTLYYASHRAPEMELLDTYALAALILGDRFSPGSWLSPKISHEAWYIQTIWAVDWMTGHLDTVVLEYSSVQGSIAKIL